MSGLIGAGNRGPFDPALDQLMAKQKLAFAKAQTFDFAALTALPTITITPIRRPTNSPPWVGNVPSEGGTIFLAASDPAAARGQEALAPRARRQISFTSTW